ncbi:MAG TPA: hypothetical protein VJ853_06370, partial [Thermoanaerobaculia bacterium]|nr:hypothetical protein [Thermoanaerobaculia bacterium]
MRRLAFLLFGLTATAAVSQEIAVTGLERGGVLTDQPWVVASGSGFTAYINVDGALRAVPVGSDGTADFSAAVDVAPPAQAAPSQNGVLLFGTENGSIFSARPGMPRSVIVRNATLQRSGCDRSGCAITFFPAGVARPSIVFTDSEGQPVSDATPLPDYAARAQNVAFIALDTGGATLFRAGTPGFLPHVVRVDRSGHVLYDTGVLASGIQARLIPIGDRTALIAPQLMNGAWSIS